MTTQQNLPQRNTAESHERICQESMASRYIHDADCCREGNAFVLFSLPRELPGLFNVRFTAPADFTPGDIFTVKGQALAVRTRLMEEPAGVLFAAGAVVRCDVDMEQGLVFVTAGGEAQAGSGNAFSPSPPLMDGTAAAGTAATVARSDHVHPTDTTRAPLNSPTFVGTPRAPTAPAGTATTQLASTEFVADAIDSITVGAAFAIVPDYAAQDGINQMPTDGSSFTVPADGFVVVSRDGDAVSRQSVMVDGVEAAGAAGSVSATLPVSAGDVVTASGAGWTAGSCYYVPPKYVPVNRQYSTDEQLTGEVWIDGKPIYRMAFTATFPGLNAEKTIGTLPAVAKSIVKIWGIANLTDGRTRPIPDYYSLAYYNFNNNSIYLSNLSAPGLPNAASTIFVEYTKL